MYARRGRHAIIKDVILQIINHTFIYTQVQQDIYKDMRMYAYYAQKQRERDVHIVSVCVRACVCVCVCVCVCSE